MPNVTLFLTLARVSFVMSKQKLKFVGKIHYILTPFTMLNGWSLAVSSESTQNIISKRNYAMHLSLITFVGNLLYRNSRNSQQYQKFTPYIINNLHFNYKDAIRSHPCIMLLQLLWG